MRGSVRALALALLATIATGGAASGEPMPEASPSTLAGVVVVTRHGVRSPTKPGELDRYAARPWPAWSVAPGELTAHGAALMTAFGRAYRARYAEDGLLPRAGCPPAGAIFLWADLDERTRATGVALASGLAPGCAIAVRTASGAVDPLFDPIPAIARPDSQRALASIAGAVGDRPETLVAANAAAFDALERVLGCDSGACARIAGVPSAIALEPKSGGAALAGPVALGSTAAENLILAYAEGLPDAGWGRLDRGALLELDRLHDLKETYDNASPYAASTGASNLMAHLAGTLDQMASGVPDARTRVPLAARLAVFVGHDTTLARLAGLLRLSWLLPDSQPNDTPPGGALVFELRRDAAREPFVRAFFVAQSLDAMRAGAAAPAARTPDRAPVYVPGCPSLDCPLATFDRVVAGAIDPQFVGAW